MPKLAGINHQAAVRALEKAGFEIVRQGKHIVVSDGTRIQIRTVDRERLVRRRGQLTAATLQKVLGVLQQMFALR